MIENKYDQDGCREMVAAFSAIPTFSGMDTSLLTAIASATMERSYKAGDVLFIEGDPAEGLYVVREGWLKACKISAKGREQVVRFVGPGETFNEIGVLSGGQCRASVETLEPSRIWIIQRNVLCRLMEKHPQMAHRITQNLATRVTHLMDLVEDLSLRSVISRLARLLLEHSTDEVTSRRKWSTQSEMASRLGTVPDVINRALRVLVEEGLIEIDRQSLKILDRKGLQNKADVWD